jgi:hypothetical protein
VSSEDEEIPVAYQLQGMLESSQAQDGVEFALERSEIGQPSSSHKVDVVDIRTGQTRDLDQPRCSICRGLDVDILDALVSAGFLFVVKLGLGDRQSLAVAHTVVGLEGSIVLGLWHKEDATQEGSASDTGILEVSRQRR